MLFSFPMLQSYITSGRRSVPLWCPCQIWWCIVCKIFGYGSYWTADDTICIVFIAGITFLLQMPVFLTFFEETGTKIPSIVHLLTSVWFYIVLFCIIGVIVLLYYLMRALSFFEKVKGVVLNVWEGVMSLKNVKNIPLFILYTILIWVLLFFSLLPHILLILFYCSPGLLPHLLCL